jgi:hypothetical protein
MKLSTTISMESIGTPEGPKLLMLTKHSQDKATTPEYFTLMIDLLIENALEKSYPCDCPKCRACKITLAKLREILPVERDRVQHGQD